MKILYSHKKSKSLEGDRVKQWSERLQILLFFLMVLLELVAIAGCLFPVWVRAQTAGTPMPPLYYQDGRFFSPDTISAERALFVLNSPPQCHACEESVAAFLTNTARIGGPPIFVVFSDVEGALARRDARARALQLLPSLTDVLYVDRRTSVGSEMLSNIDGFPALLLYDRDADECQFIAAQQLFVDDPARSDIRPSVQKRVRQFLK